MFADQVQTGVGHYAELCTADYWAAKVKTWVPKLLVVRNYDIHFLAKNNLIMLNCSVLGNQSTGYASQHIWCLSHCRCVCLWYLPLHSQSPEDFFWHQLTQVVPERGCKMVLCVCSVLGEPGFTGLMSEKKLVKQKPYVCVSRKNFVSHKNFF